MYTRYAQVIVDVAHGNVDKVFDYGIPEHMIHEVLPGTRVYVPFVNRTIEGFVLNITSQTEIETSRIRPVKELIESTPMITPALLTLVTWMTKRYHCWKVEALRLLLPTEMRRGKIRPRNVRMVTFLQDGDVSRAPRQAAVLQRLKSEGTMALSLLAELEEGATSAVAALCAKGFVKVFEVEQMRAPYRTLPENINCGPKLMPEQEIVLREVQKGLKAGGGQYLLHGITGSGKTEIYFEAIQSVLQSEKTAILLVPEISLTPQMVERFRERFGAQAAVLHSRLSAGERYDEWRRLQTGQAKVAIGARSAVFAPVQNVGIIIIDEEHEQSYKSETSPRYDAVEVAAFRSRSEGAALLLGSATPSIERYYQATNGGLQHLELPSRILGRSLPTVEIVDMREELARGNRTIFSHLLFERMSQCIQKGEQMLLFLNRRGYSTFVSCRSCGYVVQCEHCDVSMTSHIGGRVMRCHYCDAQAEVPMVCPKCGLPHIRHFGTGTEKVQMELEKLFPDITTLRMDNDTTRKKDAHLQIFSDFKQGRAQVLIGTQMIAKGLDFSEVTLVGVIAADTSLFLPDFRSAEKTFQLITQVAGRAGRADKPGKVVVQTYAPNHYAVECATAQDYKAFYDIEIANRKQSEYPPFADFIRFLFVGEDEKELLHFAANLRRFIQERLKDDATWLQNLLFMGDSLAPISRIKGKYRAQVLIKLIHTEELQKIADTLFSALQTWKDGKTISPIMEVNPTNMA